MHRHTVHPALSAALALALILTGATPTVASAQAPPEPPSEPENPFGLDPQDYSSDEGVLDLDELLAPYLTEVPPELTPEPEPPAPTEQPSPPPAPPLLSDEHVAAAAEQFEAQGTAPVVGLPTGQLYPFGEAIPEIVCLPYRTCDLELEAGERIDGLVLGDPQRWSSEFLFEGEPDRQTPHIVLKPSDFGLATNAVVVTSKRTYHFELRSPDKGEHEDEPTEYHHHVSWWYPEDWVRRARAQRAAAEAGEVQPPPSPVERPLNLSRLNFRYAVDLPRRRKHRLPWQPVTVFDDGDRTFLRLPPEARRGDLPVLLGELEDGETFPLQTRLANDWLIVPEVAHRLQLVVGTGKSRRSLTLINRETGR